VETVRLIYRGPHNPRTGTAIYPGFVPGSEADPTSANGGGIAYGWSGIQGPLAQTFAIPLLRDMVFQDPTWDWRTFDWDRDVTEVDRRVAADITALNPDLRAFAARGGKLIMYQGWGDQLNAQTLPVAYHQQVIDRFAAERGGASAARRKVDGFFRLFMAPGMAHCGGGPGFSQFDALAALREWVETGAAPKALIAAHPAFGGPGPAPTRPLCPFPAVAVYDGRGDPRRSESFACPLASAD
jgi:feruloyl esterase